MTARGPRLRSERLLLRSIEIGDVDALFALRADLDLCRYQGWFPENRAAAAELVAGQLDLAPDTPGTWFQFVILLAASGEFAGDCGVNFLADEPTTADIGYTLRREHHGRGYATEAARAMVDWLFGDLGKTRVTARTDPRNAPSIAVLERLGMRRVALNLRAVQVLGEWCDDAVYALERADWEAARGPGESTHPK